MSQAFIEKLDACTRVKLRSTQILTSLSQIISELIQNSLDANARYIDIGVNCEEWICWVKDNGSGISKDGLSLLARGSENGRYGSSKSYDSAVLNTSSTFGFRGEALASAADLSCLEISSRTASSRETWSVILKGGRNLYSGPAVRWRRESSGTVVCIRDAFYNLPVRRLSHPSPTRSLELIRQEIETYALVFPNVVFSLENIHNGGEAGPSKGRTIKIPRTSSTLASFRNLYGRALTEHVEEITLEAGELKLEGFISLNGAYSKGYQFIYVNRHILARSDLHHMIDSAFSSSSFAKNALDEDGETSLPRSNIRRSPRKVEKRPVYVLNLVVPPATVDNTLEPAKTHILFQNKNAVLALLTSCVQSFLVRHGFLKQDIPNHHSSEREPELSSPRKRRKTAIDDDSGYGESMDFGDLALKDDEHIHITDEPARSLGLTISDESPEEIMWTDTNTGETFVVDSRTGNSHRQTKNALWLKDNSSGPTDGSRRTIPKKGGGDHSDGTEHAEKSDVPLWLQKALQANRVYETAEAAMPVLNASLACQSDLPNWLDHGCYNVAQKHVLPQGPRNDFVDGTLNSVSRHFEKMDLRRAQVINQVDKKFIACLLEPSMSPNGVDPPDEDFTGPTLVLIDQHAADERVRVERFLKDLCIGFLHNRANRDIPAAGIQLRELSPPVPILLTIHEAQRLERSTQIRQAFSHWGFYFGNLLSLNTPTHTESDAGYMQAWVQNIPKVVGEKLLLGDELRDLVKGFLGQLETDMPPTSAVSLDVDDYEGAFAWIKALRWCPQGLLELVNSKACRGAIMFNDTLTLAQCENLVRQLSETAFPFQCAHGRPSLVPLANIGTPGKYHKERSCEWMLLKEKF